MVVRGVQVAEPPATPARRRQHGLGALAGLLAGALGLGTAELLSGLLAQPLTPVLGVGQAVVEAVPGDVARRAIEVLGTADKPVLVTAVTIGALVMAALTGVLTARHRGLGLLAAAALAGLGVLAVASRPELGTYGLVPALVGGLVAVLVLPVLVDALAPWPTAGASRPPPRSPSGGPARRDVLRVVTVTGGLALAATGVGRWLGARRTRVEAARAALPLPTDGVVVPAGAQLAVPGISPWATPVQSFYRIDTALSPPLVDAAGWRLRVHGMVEREVELDLADLTARPPVQAWITLNCVSNEVGGDLIGNARWTGVRIADLLRQAGVRPGADAVLSTSADGFTVGTPVEALTDGRDALLAYAMDGQPLPVEHGFPVRMIVPGLYGFVSATKWVVDLEVTRFADISAYWTSRGWSAQAPVKTASRIDVPRDGSRLAPGRVAVAGVAWAQHRGIRTVQVRVDGGPWRAARLGGVPGDDTWRQWVWEWDATPGTHLLQVRATDGTGAAQTDQEAPPAPDGATGLHSVEVDVG